MTNRFSGCFNVFFLAIFFLTGCRNNNPLFNQTSSDRSGVYFNNKITETDSINILDNYNVYNGGGVGIGDFNNDGWEDIYFTGNLVENTLYLNKGNFRFEDVTHQAGVTGNGKWCMGVSVLDINNDGWLDIYVSVSINQDPLKRENLLYINTGTDKDGIPRFKEMAKEYGLNDTTYTTQAVFFDYDNDGDLDVYLCVNQILPDLYPNKFRPVIRDGSFPSTGRLYRNDWNDALGHPVFTNVSKEAGITIEGYGHSVTITDINLDGWKDIYVANDFLSSNILYINNRDGTFTDKISLYLKHSSANAMGVDIADINNDGLLDIIELDMLPEDNLRKKMMLMPVSYQTYQNIDRFGYHYQYVKNTLQLNMGNRILENGSIGDPIFAEIGFYSNVAETDWSWAPLVADFDNDSYRDIIVTNGFPKDVTDHDFAAYRNKAYLVATKQQLLEQIPEAKLHNYAFRNNGNLRFSNESFNWGLGVPSFSTGAAYADLDNDGNLDLVVNNINDEAFIYENTLNKRKNKRKDPSHNYLRVKFEGNAPNRDAFGTWVKIFYNGNQQVYEHYTVRGYLSSVSAIAHFGLGNNNSIDSVLVIWPDNTSQTLYNVKANQVITVKQIEATANFDWQSLKKDINPLFTEITHTSGINFTHLEIDYIDFNVQKLLPRKFSEQGPAIAAGDINGDGLDDFIVGGSYGNSAKIFFQNDAGKFHSVDLVPDASPISKTTEDIGILLFDADNDGDLDLYITSGGYESPPYSVHYRDKFYVNDGKGNFSLDTTAFPVNYTSKSCVKAFDFDKDGYLDLFIGGRVEPWRYPKPVSSFILRNDSKNGVIKFTDVTQQVAPELNNIGLVSDALWTDYNNDGWTDLIVAGEWMPVTFFKNQNGKLVNETAQSGIASQVGWWNSITGGDFDNDGDMDYVLGNVGLNLYYRANEKYPVNIYAADFNNDGNYDAIPSLFLPASATDKTRKEFPAHGRDDMAKQMIETRFKFTDYNSYARATISQLFTKGQLDSALKLSVNNLQSVYIENKGNGKFAMKPLPDMAQISCLYGMVVEDFDNDGNLDLLINGNDFGIDVSIGRYDALNGLVLKGNGDGTFMTYSMQQSGIFIPGNGRAICMLASAGKNPFFIASQNRYYTDATHKISEGENPFFVASQNRGGLKLYALKNNYPVITVPANTVFAELILSDGKKRKVEFPLGSSYLSQSTRSIIKTGAVKQIACYDINGKKIIFNP